MPRFHLLTAKGELKRVYPDAEVEIRDRVLRIYSTKPPYPTVAIISLSPGDRLENVNEN